MRPTILALTAALALAACVTTPPGPGAPQPSKVIDPARFYTGTWREVGRRPMSFTDGCVAGSTTYTPGDRPGRYTVVDDCHEGSPAGKVKDVKGKGTIQDPGTNAKLKVRYFGGFVTRDYWVLDRADDYSWFISGDPTLRDLYIYTREVPSPALLAQLKGRAEALGYDVGKLEFPPQ